MELEEERAKSKKRDFNLSAMKQLIDENGFLKSKYDKLSVNAEERFGYHWNEVICNVLYNKYVKNDPKILERYKALKIKHDIEKDRTEIKDARPDISAYQDNTEEKQVTEQINKDKKMENNKELNEMSAGGGASTGDGGLTGNASGAYETPVAFAANNKNRKFFKNTLVRGSKIVSNATPDNNITLKEESTFSKLYEEFGSLITEFEHTFMENDGQQTTQPKVLTYHIVTNNENEFYADVRDNGGNTVFEINSLDELNKLMTQGMKSKEDIDGLSAVLKSQGKMTDSDVLELAELNESKPTNEIRTATHQNLGLVTEEVKPNGMVQAERIKAVNQENSLNYYKTLNDGIQDMIKADKPNNVEITATIKYEFDDNGVEVVNGVFPEEGKYNTEYQETAHRGTEDYILDRPDAKYDERLKKMVGTKAYNILKDKQKVIMNKELRNTTPGRFIPVENPVNESILSGYYQDMYGNKKIKSTKISKVQECEVLAEGVKYFETKGLGNASSEQLKEEIDTYNFYYNLHEDNFVKIKKEKDAKKDSPVLNESINKMKYLTTYDPSINVKNIIDHSKL